MKCDCSILSLLLMIMIPTIELCSYTLRKDAVEKHWARRAHAVDAQWQLLALHEHAMSAPWPRYISPVRTSRERSGTPWTLLGNATVAVGVPWHLHVMENVKLFARFFSIFVRSPDALRNIKSPCQRHGIAVKCNKCYTIKLTFYCNRNQSYYLFLLGVILGGSISILCPFLGLSFTATCVRI